MPTRALRAWRHSPQQLHLPGENRLVTLRLIDSLPLAVTTELLERFGPTAMAPHADPDLRKRHFAAWDAALDRAGAGPTWLRKGAVVRVVRETLEDFARRDFYGLLAWTILPNHLHFLVRLPPQPILTLSEVLHRYKSRTAQLANCKLGREGAFWESADSVLEVSDEAAALCRVVRYVVQNAVRAGLTRRWDKWPHTWVTDELWAYEAAWAA